MKSFILKSIAFTCIFCLGLIATFFFIKANWQSSNPGSAADSDLFINGTGTLNKDKWNNLVSKSLVGVKLFNCEKNFTCGTAPGGWSTSTNRTAAECGGTYKPSDFTNCFYAVRKFGGTNVSYGFHAIRPSTKNDISVYCSYNGFNVSMNYMCWN